MRLILLALILTGCATATSDPFKPLPRDPCQVPIIVDGVEKACVSRATLQRMLRRAGYKVD